MKQREIRNSSCSCCWTWCVVEHAVISSQLTFSTMFSVVLSNPLRDIFEFHPIVVFPENCLKFTALLTGKDTDLTSDMLDHWCLVHVPTASSDNSCFNHSSISPLRPMTKKQHQLETKRGKRNWRAESPDRALGNTKRCVRITGIYLLCNYGASTDIFAVSLFSSHALAVAFTCANVCTLYSNWSKINLILIPNNCCFSAFGFVIVYLWEKAVISNPSCGLMRQK